MNLKVVIPTANRAETITTNKLVAGDFQVCVPESQAEAYAKSCGAEHVLVHPEGMGKAAKINWYFETQEYDAVVFLDDDLLSLFRCWRSRAQSDMDSSVTDPEFIRDLLEKTAALAKELGAFLFGWSTSARHAVYYTGFRPFRLKGYVNSASIGFINGHGLRFDERIQGKGDYDISLQNALKHRYCLVDQRFAFQYKPSFVGAGSMRNTMAEQETMRLLRAKWGDCIKVMSTSEGKDARLNRKKRAGAENIYIKLPY